MKTNDLKDMTDEELLQELRSLDRGNDNETYDEVLRRLSSLRAQLATARRDAIMECANEIDDKFYKTAIANHLRENL